MKLDAVSDQTAVLARHGALVRWLLLPLLLGGIFTFHVLSDHEPASAQHVLGAPAATVDTAGTGTAVKGIAFSSTASYVTPDATGGCARSGPQHLVNACDVFLNATGGSVLLLLLGWALTGDTVTRRNRSTGNAVSRGPPPLTGRPRLALCVNRT